MRRIGGAQHLAQHQRVVKTGQPDHQLVTIGDEAQLVGGDQRAELQHIGRAAGIEQAVGAVTDTEVVGVVQRPALQLVGAEATVQPVGTVVEAHQQVVAVGATQHRQAHLGQRPQRAVDEIEGLDQPLVQPIDDAQLVARFNQREHQIAAVAAHTQRGGVDQAAEHHPVDGAGKRLAVEHLGHGVEPVAQAEDIGVGRAAAEQLVVALPAVEDVLAVDQAGDHVVAPAAAGDQQQLFHVGDRPSGAVVEVELLHPGQGRRELVADTQRVNAISDADQQVVAVLREAQVVDRDVGAETHMVVIEPAAGFLDIEDGVVAVAHVEAVAVAVARSDQQIVARQPVDGLGEVRAPQRVGARGADQVHVFGVQVGVGHHLVTEAQHLDGVLLATEAVVLVRQRDAFAGVLDGEGEVFLEARDHQVVEGHVGEIERIAARGQQWIARGIEHRVVAVAAPHHVGVAVDAAFEPVVAGTAVDHVVAVEADDHVVAVGARLGQQHAGHRVHVPHRAVDEAHFVDVVEVIVAEQHGRGELELIQQRHPILAAAQRQRDGERAGIAQQCHLVGLDIAQQLQRVVRGREKVLQVVLDHVVAVTAVEDVGVVQVVARQVVVGQAAVEAVFGMEAEDGVLLLGPGLLDGQAHHVGFAQETAVGKHQPLDAIEPDHAEDPGVDRVKLVGQRHPVAGGRAHIVDQRDDQVVGIAQPGEAQVVGAQRGAELQHVDMLEQDVVVVVLDAVLAVAEVEDVQVGVAPATQDVVATPAVQHVDGRRAGHQVVAVHRVAGGPGDVEVAPRDTVGEGDLHHFSVGRQVAAEQPRPLAVELVAHRQHVVGAQHLDHQVDAVLVRIDLGRLDVREAQRVVAARHQRRLGVLDHVVAEVLAHHVQVAAQPAAVELIARPQHEEVAAAGAVDQRGRGVVQDDLLFVDAKDLGRLQQLGVDGHVVVGGHHHLQHEGFRLGAGVVAVQIGVDHVHHLAPLGEVGRGRIAAGRRALEDGLEHRRQLAARGGDPGIGLGVIGDAAEHLGQPALRRQVHRRGAAEEAVMRHQVVEEVDRLGDRRVVMQHAR